MERDTEAFIEGLSEEIIITSDPVLQYLMVDALHMLAIVHDTKEQRAAFTKRGLEFAEHEKADKVVKKWLGPLLNNAGWDALEDGDFNQAIALFIRAVAERKEALDDFHVRKVASNMHLQ